MVSASVTSACPPVWIAPLDVVLSEGTRTHDEQVKGRLFERHGVRESWLVDPELDLIKVYRRSEDGAFSRAEERAVITSPLLPDFSLALEELFAPMG